MYQKLSQEREDSYCSTRSSELFLEGESFELKKHFQSDRFLWNQSLLTQTLQNYTCQVKNDDLKLQGIFSRSFQFHFKLFKEIQ